MNPAQGGWLIFLTLMVAMVLSALYLPQDWPQWLAWLRPTWVMLAVFFWVVEVPHRIGLISTWLIGLLVDVLYAEPLGLNGLILSILTFVTWRFYERLRMFSIPQQGGVVFLLILMGEAMRMVVLNLTMDRELTWMMVLPALTSLALWPFVWPVLTSAKNRFRVE
ncbi:MAG: rod shape-determining protein MreD [Proteobacteria bacterium]|nr:rod shape-determining protein MreD [Pseudomonadota bacterium]